MNLFDVLQLLGGLILAIGYIPQIHQLIKTKSSRDINLKTYIMMSLGVGLMEVYAVNLVVNGSGLMFLITNTISLACAVVVMILVIIYKDNKRGKLK